MIESPNRSLIIAEAGVNHNGSVDMAIALIDAAADSDADIVKFQSFRADALVSRYAAKAEYQINSTGSNESQLEMIRRLELSEQVHLQLLDHSRKRGIGFLSTPFDPDSARFLVNDLGLTTLKIPSGEITNGPLLLSVSRLGCPMIMSTGMSTLGEIETALGVIAFGYLGENAKPSLENFRDAYASDKGQELLKRNLTLLHCTTEYPAPFAEVNLEAIDTLRRAFGLPVGLSDHTEGIAIAIAAAARKASVIEKHFTLDRKLPGPDHRASLEPAELALMVKSIRQVEAAIGEGCKRPSPSELKNMAVARRSLVAATKIQAGETFSERNMAVKRPGQGISPMDYWNRLGRKAPRDFSEDEPLE